MGPYFTQYSTSNYPTTQCRSLPTSASTATGATTTTSAKSTNSTRTRATSGPNSNLSLTKIKAQIIFFFVAYFIFQLSRYLLFLKRKPFFFVCLFFLKRRNLLL